MKDILRQINQNEFKEAVLEAQTHATRLYTKFGFIEEGRPYLDEDGIEHIFMRKALS